MMYTDERYMKSALRAFNDGLSNIDRFILTYCKENEEAKDIIDAIAELVDNLDVSEWTFNMSKFFAETLNTMLVNAGMVNDVMTEGQLLDMLMRDVELFYMVDMYCNPSNYPCMTSNIIKLSEDTTEQQTEHTDLNEVNKMENINQNTEQNTEHQNTEVKMNENTNTNNQNTEQNTTLNEVNNMSNQNNNTEQNSEQPNQKEKFISLMVDLALKPRSSLPSKLAELNDIQYAVDNAYKEDISYYYMSLLEHKSYDLRLKISRMVLKKAKINAKEEDVYHVAYLLMDTCANIVERIEEGRKDKKPAVSKAITHNEAVEYAKDLTLGKKARSAGVARDLKNAALIIAYHKSNNTLDNEDVGKALDKVYASVRRQGKKNGEELGGKSNKPTKDAAKKAVLDILVEMIDTHSYKFDVIIGEA